MGSHPVSLLNCVSRKNSQSPFLQFSIVYPSRSQRYTYCSTVTRGHMITGQDGGPDDGYCHVLSRDVWTTPKPALPLSSLWLVYYAIWFELLRTLNFSLHVHLQTLLRKQLSHLSARQSYSSNASTKFATYSTLGLTSENWLWMNPERMILDWPTLTMLGCLSPCHRARLWLWPPWVRKLA